MAGVAQQPGSDQHDDMKDCPMHAQHASHQHTKGELDKRGDKGMGFAQDKTTHHFLLRNDGGVIQVTANLTNDKDSQEQIAMHLRHIAQAFQSGEFDIPMFVHDQTPPGVGVMTKLKERIHYAYEPVEKGGRVVITSNDAEALRAIHDFLKFQITEHQTGDPVSIQ
jgi:hypothetical protein